VTEAKHYSFQNIFLTLELQVLKRPIIALLDKSGS